jgi:DNA-binding MarR family transcriptional regulator
MREEKRERRQNQILSSVLSVTSVAKNSAPQRLRVHVFKFHYSPARTSSDKVDMGFDSLIANPGRLRILTALVSEPRQEFVQLRGVTRMTDGNLATHARRLQNAGMVDVEKTFRDGKPVTTFSLTPQGRDALQQHVNRLVEALEPPIPPADHPVEIQATSETFSPALASEPDESDWID